MAANLCHSAVETGFLNPGKGQGKALSWSPVFHSWLCSRLSQSKPELLLLSPCHTSVTTVNQFRELIHLTAHHLFLQS